VIEHDDHEASVSGEKILLVCDFCFDDDVDSYRAIPPGIFSNNERETDTGENNETDNEHDEISRDCGAASL
jgi:hypothetical protein